MFAGLSISAKANSTITTGNPIVVIRSSYSTAPFDKGMGGTFMAAPVKKAPGYELYDVVIWPDRISLYKFDNDFEQQWTKHCQSLNSSGDLPYTPGTTEYNDWIDKEYHKFRESFLLKEVICENNEDNINLNSNIRLNAYKEFFNIIKKATPSTNIVIKYYGHGHGTMFCGALSQQDSLSILKYGVSLFGSKFAIIDYGTNCGSGTTEVLDFYSDYTDYMNVSQLNFGGFQYDDQSMEAYLAADSNAQYHNMFAVGKTTRDASIRIASQAADAWAYSINNLKNGRIAQSATAVDMEAYRNFRKIMKRKLKTPDRRDDLYALIKKNKTLLKLYSEMIMCYIDNRSILGGEWNEGEGITYAMESDLSGTKSCKVKGHKYRIIDPYSLNPSVEYSGPVNKKATKISIPSSVTIDGETYTVSSVGSNAFNSCSKIKSIVIPDSVEEIQKNAFKKVGTLSTITINSDKIAFVGKNAFMDTSKDLKIKIKAASKGAFNAVVKIFKASGSSAKKLKYSRAK